MKRHREVCDSFSARLRARPPARLQRLAAAFLLLPFAFLLLPSASAQYGRPPESSLPPGENPRILQEVAIEQRLNAELPLDAAFRDEAGRAVRLGDYFGEKPVILALVYYECPMLCNQVLNGLLSSLNTLTFTAGREFTVVAVSFDARETPALAAQKKESYLRRYGRGAEGAAGWSFLTGEQGSIDRLTEAVGFRYQFDERSNQFAHGSAIMVATPQGRLSHYFYGIEYAPRDVRLALVQSSANRIGTPVDQLLLYCYHYDPTTGQYGPVIMNILRLAGIATVVGLAGLILVLRRRGNRWKVSVSRGGTA